MSEFGCGIDFGTTNSSAAVATADGLRVLPLDAANDNPVSLPSLVYIARDGGKLVGRQAANAFIDRNVGREVRLEQVDLGLDIEAYVAAEPDKESGYRPPENPNSTREAVRARATVEVNSPGRLFQSLKSSLRMRDFRGTDVFGQHFQIEELVSLVLSPLKAAVDAATGRDVERAVFGRPVRFSPDTAEDAVAEHRLRTAASLAGFKEVVFFYEPVAACVEYAIETGRRQRLMVVDIGGGTCDVCVMEFGGAQGAAARLAESRILGVAGVPVAGDAIDQEIVREKLFPCFGSRARYGPANLRLPQYVLNAVLDWQNLYKLNTEETINWLIAAESSSTDPGAIRALRTLIQRNYGYVVMREVEAAKKRLSSAEEARIVISEEGLEIDETLLREEFPGVIAYPLEKMHASIVEAEKSAGLRPEGIDRVLTTGGTSLIPAVKAMLSDRFGGDKVLQRDTFTSVAQGLALVAQYA